MRITHKLIFNSLISRIQRNQNKLFEIEEHLASGKRINRPSDDPVASARVNKLRGQLAKVKQYLKNIDEGVKVTSAIETAISDIKDQIVRAREIVMQQLGGIQDEQARQAAASELEQIKEQILQQANVKHEGKFLFAGFASTTEPFDSSGNYLGRSGDEFEIEIGESEYLKLNFCGDELMITPDGINIIQLIDDVRNLILAGNTDELRDRLPALQSSLDHITNKISEVGARQNRLESAKNSQEALEYNITLIISQLEDLDTVEAFSQYAAQKLVLEATMQSTANYLSQSFLDFLK